MERDALVEHISGMENALWEKFTGNAELVRFYSSEIATLSGERQAKLRSVQCGLPASRKLGQSCGTSALGRLAHP